ncbi:hypothetical protein FF36_06215 [Frankia torreyi]|uniref:DUF7680 domain-containing protein n=1 Tax=Frankia torreyi TaxID=1856 RepID=A0A0D8B6E8_9ACTN|nr:hypothetical protein [Frankia torreyi]KJE19504.1 hypothetical protein FF36_06215 [Frankia torreyi]
MTAARTRFVPARQARTFAVRAFSLHILPASGRDGYEGYGVRLDESYGSRERSLATTVATATPLQTSRILSALLTAVRASGKPHSVLSPSRRQPVVLDEAAGVRLALTLFATQRVTKPTRIGALVAAVASMSTEETYYWYAKAVGPDADRVRRALRLFLAAE